MVDGGKNLEDMIFNLFKRAGTVSISYKQLCDSFTTVGKRYDMGEGKWVELIEKSDKHRIIKCFMPSGSHYHTSLHDDANETLTVISGKLSNDNFKMVKGSMGQFTWKAGTAHNLTAKEDSVFYSRFDFARRF